MSGPVTVASQVSQKGRNAVKQNILAGALFLVPRLCNRHGRLRRSLLSAYAFVVTCGLAGIASAYDRRSDINSDGVVDLADVVLFAQMLPNVDWKTFDWCTWTEKGDRQQEEDGRRQKKDGRRQQKRDALIDYIRDYFECDAPPSSTPATGPLAVVNENNYPTRLAWAPSGELYVSDARVGSIFIYTPGTDDAGLTTLTLTGELKRLGHIVSVAVDQFGVIYAGDTQRKRIAKYNLKGELIGVIGEGTIRMPTDLASDRDGNLYVADSRANVVWVFKPNGSLLRTIRRGGLNRPLAVEVQYVVDAAGVETGEVYVADNGNYLIRVYDLNGNLLRSYGGFVEKEGWFSPTWITNGKFVSLQSLAVDTSGNVHALDSYMNFAQILNGQTGDFISAYGESGTDPGQMRLPLDLILGPNGSVIVANADNHRVEVFYPVP